MNRAIYPKNSHCKTFLMEMNPPQRITESEHEKTVLILLSPTSSVSEKLGDLPKVTTKINCKTKLH
jgi:hypothetical protein